MRMWARQDTPPWLSMASQPTTTGGSMTRTLIAAAIALAAAGAVHAAGFKLESPDLKPNAMMDKKFEANVFGCGGENKSPVLKWSGAPKDTKSFAVTVY